MIRKICLAITLLSACSYAAADAGGTGYIGLGVGSVDYGIDSSADFDNPMGFELIIGHEVNRNVAFELSYIDFGTSENGATPKQKVDASAITAGALLGGKLGKSANVFVKLGLQGWDSELSQDGSGVIASKDGTDIFYGFGVMVKATNSISLGARYNIYDFDGDDVSMLSVNAQLNF
jgi:opacity protein-like surface antigen